LILGSSLSENAINPEFINKKTANIAFVAQPISIDYYLLDKYIDQMPGLHTVSLEINVQNFYYDLNPLFWNGHIYSILYNIKYNVEPWSIKNYSLVISNYQFFSSRFFDHINPFSYKYKLNRFGSIVNDFNDRFEKLNFDTSQINNTFSLRKNLFENEEHFTANKSFVRKIIERCKAKNIRVVMLTPSAL
jgi:hypothetical protein